MKAIFFGKVKGIFPIFFVYLLVGLIVNSFSSYGINGNIEGWPQVESTFLATAGIFILLFSAPGFSYYLVMILFGWFGPVFKWIFNVK